MSRVLVGFGETADHRGRTPDGRTDAEMDMDFLNVCYTRAPKGQLFPDLEFGGGGFIAPLGLLCGKRLKIDVCVCVCVRRFREF